MEPVFFADAAELRAWFAAHHADAPELLVGYYKKHTGRPSVQHTEAIEQALCFGSTASGGASTTSATRCGSRRGARAACGARSTWRRSLS